MASAFASRAIAPALVIGAVAAGVIPLLWFMVERGGVNQLRFDSGLWNILRFTLLQAALSTFCSVTLGVLAARALARRQFLGRHFLIAAFAVPQALPAIVAVLGMLAVYGTTGLLAGMFSAYGIAGIVLVHVFFNLPLATRLCLDVLQDIAPETFRLAEQLSFSDGALFRHVEAPALKSALPRIASLIFLLCAASFVVVLTLGGPGATTLEVAIYQSLRMDFDVGRAASLSLVQVVMSIGLVLLAGRVVLHIPATKLYRLNFIRQDGQTLLARLVDFTSLFVASLLVLPPLLAIAIYGLPHIAVTFAIFEALAFSILIGIFSAMLTLPLAWALARNNNHVVALAGLMVPPVVLATGWFLALRTINGSLSLTISLVVALNSLMALPFAVAILAEGFARLGPQHSRLCMQLGLQGWNRFWRIDLPALRGAVMQTLLMSFVFSLGDLTAVTLLGSHGLVTLPALIHQQMGLYRASQAEGTALILTVLCLIFAALAQRIRATHD